MNPHTALAVLDIVAVSALAARRADVRLVLVLGALPLYLSAHKLPLMVGRIAAEMANPATVVPICSALGFAHVLKLTGCDRHLVRALVRPLRGARPLMTPGGILAGYLVNTAVVSQTGTAAVVGPVLIPVLRAGGLSPTSAGSLLLLGSSMGGELFNPGAVEMRKLAELTGRDAVRLVERSAPMNLLACGTALVAFWALAALRERRRPAPPVPVPGSAPESEPEPEPEPPIHPVKALIPLLPLVLLFLAHAFGKGHLPRELDGPATILAAMLVGVGAAGLTTPRAAGGISSAFFEGAGYAYTHVISLIVTATVFAEGVRESGLIREATAALVAWPGAALAAGMAVPWLLALVSGTGIAPAVAVMEALVPAAPAMGLDPTRLGVVTALGAHFGRTMSPAAAVVLMSARLSGSEPAALIRRVTPPLLIGGAVLLVAALLTRV